MLYKITGLDSQNAKLNPIEFYDFSHYDKIEKDLENLIANNLLDTLFEDYRLFPIFQERQYQAEADIYALNEKGELVIFELKRSTASQDAVLQALRYAQDAGKWTFSELQNKYEIYSGYRNDLLIAHQDAFNLENPLSANDINKKQYLIIVGSAADDNLIDSVNYWKKNLINIDFLPYRIYEISGELYFEFFALPYDIHINPSDIKGVLFDTNRSYDENSIWYMIENDRVAAFDEAMRFVEYLNPGDYVFFSHKKTGVVAAAKVKRGGVKKDNEDTLYQDVEFLTRKPSRENPLKGYPFSDVSTITGKSFYWARTIKVPYLTKDESENLLEELRKYL
ncbi:MAG: hypothetical protein KBG04_08015 [Bacteroidales bacterium]|nr:hypothetical protein [Bacteroidales bacterium]